LVWTGCNIEAQFAQLPVSIATTTSPPHRQSRWGHERQEFSILLPHEGGDCHRWICRRPAVVDFGTENTSGCANFVFMPLSFARTKSVPSELQRPAQSNPGSSRSKTHAKSRGQGRTQRNAGHRSNDSAPLGIREADANEAYSPNVKSKGFSPEEKVWIGEVLKLPQLSLILGAYGGLPPLVLHRVESLNGSNGQFSTTGQDIALSDRIYEIPEWHKLEDGSSFRESAEESFKATLIHELFHYVEKHSSEFIGKVPTPKNLINALLYPEKIGLEPMAFGWYLDRRINVFLHFDLSFGLGDVRSRFGTVYEQMRETVQWESSPMPQSGQLISPEEDLATSLGNVLASARMAEAFRAKYPRRYALLDRYVRLVSSARDASKKH
jgi:hypothetical protein